MSVLRRLANACFGHGPWHAAPFAEIARDRLDYHRRGVHRAEDFSGEVCRMPGEAAVYGPAHSLLGQPATWEMLPDGPRYREEGIAFSPPQVLYSLCEAGIATGDGIVYCPRTRRAVLETLRGWTRPALHHPLLGAPRFPRAQVLPGRTLSLLTLSGDGFYHLLLEAIPRLHLAADLLPHCDHVLANGGPGGFHEKWLTHAGVPAAKIRWADGFTHYRCEQLCFTAYPMRDQQPSPWTVQALRARLSFVPATRAPHRRLWISRNDARHRRLAWETELLSLLPGFDRVELAGLSPSEQMRLFSEAAAVAGPHGAGLAHVAFCPPSSMVFELFPDAHRQPIYHRLAHLAGARYHWATVDFAEPKRIDELAAAITRALA